jgi:hypothetical protein
MRATKQCYPRGVIRDLEAYRELREEEYWNALSRRSIEESIAVGEALLTSEIMETAVFPDDDHPLTLARSLGIQAQLRNP